MDLNLFNVNEFDQIVQKFYEGNNTERQAAQTMLTEFRKNPDSWQVADQILEHSSNFQSKFIALGILQDFVKVKWNLLPMDQRLVMRNYVVKLIVELTSDENTLRSKSVYINKLDQILVQILKKDWPKHWPTFIQEMVDSGLANTNLCENNMKILKYLSEDIFDFSNDFMTVAHKTKLKNQMVAEFNPVFDLCKKILSTASANVYLTTATLEALLKFISWIPPQYLLQEDFVNILKSHYNQAQTAHLRNLCLQCFTELINLETISTQENGYFLLAVFNLVYEARIGILPADKDINQFYDDCSNEEQHYFQLLAIFLTSFLSKHLENIPNLGTTAVHAAFKYLLLLSRIKERELWKICLEFWSNQPLPVYGDILQELCHVMIDNMVKPDDIFMIENDDGEITREFIKQSDTTALSKSTQLLFGKLAHSQYEYVCNMILERLQQLQLSNTTWDEQFRLSWAIGCMSGALSEQIETSFLDSVLQQNVFQLQQSNQDQDWVVASCLFYIAEQYPRYLMSHLDYTSALFQRMFAYMQQSQAGVRDMACDTFMKISKGCKEGLSQPFLNNQSVLEFTVMNLDNLTAQLDPSQMLLYYEAVSTIIASLPTIQAQEQPIALLMDSPNRRMNSAFVTMNSLASVKTVYNIIRLHKVVCQTLGSAYKYHFYSQCPAFMNAYSQSSKHKVGANNDLYHRVCESVIKLVETYFLSVNDLDLQPRDDTAVVFNVVKLIMDDYKCSVEPLLKEPQVLHLLAIIIEKLQKPVLPDFLKEVIDIAYVVTLPLITSNFVDFPDIRLEFYGLLQALNKHCFTELYQSQELFQLNINSIMWGTKHTQKEISEISLQTCLDMIQYVSQMEDEDMSSEFFERYYVRILTDILEILVDPDCRNGFKLQSSVLARLLELVQEGEIYTRLFSPEQMASSNVEYIQKYVLDLLCTAFPLLQKDQIEVLVMGMFEYSGELERFQDDIRDFLIDIREVGDESEGQQRADDELNAELDLLRNS